MAVSLLSSALKKYGREVLISALSCITKTRRGNPGMIRAGIVEALCAVLDAEPEFGRDRARLIFAMQTFDFNAEFNDARTASIGSGKKVSGHLIEAIAAHLESFSIAARAAPKAPAISAPAPTSPPVAAVVNGAKAVIHNGIAVDATPKRESVAFNGRQIPVSPRGARLVAALAKARPNCIGDDFLISKIWNVRPAHAADLLEMVVHDDLAGLKKIGLEVRTQRGIGRQLAEIKR